MSRRTKAEIEDELAACRQQQERQAETIGRLSEEHLDLQEKLGIFPLIHPVDGEPIAPIESCPRSTAHGRHYWELDGPVPYDGDNGRSCLGVLSHPTTMIGGNNDE